MRARRIFPDPRIGDALRAAEELRRREVELERVIWDQQDQLNEARESVRSWRAVAEAWEAAEGGQEVVSSDDGESDIVEDVAGAVGATRENPFLMEDEAEEGTEGNPIEVD